MAEVCDVLFLSATAMHEDNVFSDCVWHDFNGETVATAMASVGFVFLDEVCPLSFLGWFEVVVDVLHEGA